MRLGLLCVTIGMCLAWAAGAVTAPDVELQAGPKAIVAQQIELRAQMQAGKGRFIDMPQIKKASIAREQAVVLDLLDGRESLDELSPQQRMEAANALQSINASIANTADERIVCQREKPIGSNMVVRRCRSVAQINADREAGKDELRVLSRTCPSCKD